MTIELVLDPGHGGADPGTTGGGLIEKDYQLQVALRVKQGLLERYEGFNLHMTRESDVDVSLRRRTEIANALPDAVFFSFHHDACATPSVRGGTIYVYGPQSWVPAVTATALNRLKHAVSGVDGKFPWDGPGHNEPGGGVTVQGVNHQAPRSYALAQLILPQFKAMLAKYGIPCKGIYAGDFQVLRDTNCRAILFEAFYATSPVDSSIAKGPAFMLDLAGMYVETIASTVGLTRKATWSLPKVKVVLPNGVEVWGEVRNGQTWMPLTLPGAKDAVWVPIRAVADALGHTVDWVNTPPTCIIK